MSSSETKHTPTPWNRNKYGAVVDGAGKDVAFRGVMICCAGSRVSEAEANTDLIVRAVNSHDLMVEALVAADLLSRKGLLNAAEGEIERVNELRRAALSAAEA